MASDLYDVTDSKNRTEDLDEEVSAMMKPVLTCEPGPEGYGEKAFQWSISFPTTGTDKFGNPRPPHRFFTKDLNKLKLMLIHRRKMLRNKMNNQREKWELSRSRGSKETGSELTCASCWLVLGSKLDYDSHISFCPIVCLKCGEIFNDNDNYQFHQSRSNLEDCAIHARSSSEGDACDCAMCV